MSTENKYALVTGGTGGIGFELARLLAKDGYNLVIVARGTEGGLEKAAATLQQDYGINVISVSKDLFQTNNAFEVYNEVKNQGIDIDVLVNDAGMGNYGLFLETDIHKDLEIIQLNTSSLVVLTKCFLKDMVARGQGKILNVASIASKVPGPYQSVYHATKAFVLSFSESVNNEVKDTGVTITALLPGATDTDFFNKADMKDSKILQTGLADPAKVALDGYEALMKGDDKVISGFKNKAMVAMSNMMTDSMAAETMRKQQEPVENK